MVLLNIKVTKNTENQKIKKQPPLPCGGGLGITQLTLINKGVFSDFGERQKTLLGGIPFVPAGSEIDKTA
jgi:hypothetical protein